MRTKHMIRAYNAAYVAYVKGSPWMGKAVLEMANRHAQAAMIEASAAEWAHKQAAYRAQRAARRERLAADVKGLDARGVDVLGPAQTAIHEFDDIPF